MSEADSAGTLGAESGSLVGVFPALFRNLEDVREEMEGQLGALPAQLVRAAQLDHVGLTQETGTKELVTKSSHKYSNFLRTFGWTIPGGEGSFRSR